MRIFNKMFGQSKTGSSSDADEPDFASMTQISQIASCFEWIFQPDTQIAKESAETICKLLNSQSSFKNKSLYNSLKYIHLKPKDLIQFCKYETHIQNSLFCIASMNSNGYVREEALTFLIKSPTQKTFPFILFRLADWVPTIRRTAEFGIRQLIQQKEPFFLIRHHKIIDWLLKVERADLQGIHQEITEFIFGDSNIEHLLDNNKNYEDGDRFFIFKNLIARNKLDREIFEKILTDKNYLIRLLAVRNMNLIDQPDILKRLLRDRNQKIRNYAIHKIPEFQLEQFQTELNHLLFDNSASIRAISRRLLSIFSSLEYKSIYRNEVRKNPKPGSIIGLSEIGSNEDLKVLMDFISADLANQRAAGLIAISNLNYEKAKEHAFKMLNDSSHWVKKSCFKILSKEQSKDDLTKLRSIYNQGSSATKRFTLKIINQYGGWDIAGDFLKGIYEKDPKIKAKSFAYLNGWYHYSRRLGTEQKETDRDYVMKIYNNMNFEALDIPRDIKKIVDEIPFIFTKK